jgi:hypothetical protein
VSRLGEFAKGTADIVKLLALIVSALGIVGAGVHFVAWLSNRADATEMAVRFTAVNARQDVAEAKAANEQEWRRAIWEQTTAIARRVGAQTVPPPVISTVPVPVNGDAH